MRPPAASIIICSRSLHRSHAHLNHKASLDTCHRLPSNHDLPPPPISPITTQAITTRAPPISIPHDHTQRTELLLLTSTSTIADLSISLTFELLISLSLIHDLDLDLNQILASLSANLLIYHIYRPPGSVLLLAASILLIQSTSGQAIGSHGLSTRARRSSTRCRRSRFNHRDPGTTISTSQCHGS